MSKGKIAIRGKEKFLVPGVQAWQEGIDRNPETMGLGRETGRFLSFLKEKYRGIKALNKLCRTRFGKEVGDNSPILATGEPW